MPKKNLEVDLSRYGPRNDAKKRSGIRKDERRSLSSSSRGVKYEERLNYLLAR